MNGPAELVLSGTNTFSGGIAVDAGTLIFTNGSACPDGSKLGHRGGRDAYLRSERRQPV